MKKLQTTQKSGVEVQKTEQSAAWVLEHSYQWVFLEKLFQILETGLHWALAAAMGTWVRAWPSRKGPPGRAEERSKLQTPGEPAEDCFISK